MESVDLNMMKSRVLTLYCIAWNQYLEFAVLSYMGFMFCCLELAVSCMEFMGFLLNLRVMVFPLKVPPPFQLVNNFFCIVECYSGQINL